MDLNNDGLIDLLSGSYSRRGAESMAGTFFVFWGQEGGGYSQAAELNGTDGAPLIIPAEPSDRTEKICTRPFATDWDGDGDVDLIVGNFAGSFYLFEGEGEGNFAPEPKPVMAGDSPLKVFGMHSDPFMVDWDGDGDMDLLSGSAQGGVFYAENTAGPGSTPRLTDFEALIAPPTQGQPTQGMTPTGPAGSTRVWCDDINGDGKIDLLVGDQTTLLIHAPGLTEEEVEQRQARWQEGMEDFQRRMAEITPENRNSEEAKALLADYGTHYNSRSEFITQVRTGFVWLYLQQ